MQSMDYLKLDDFTKNQLVSLKQANPFRGVKQNPHDENSRNKKPVIFLGPSLSLNEAKKILDADYRAPIRRGDLILALNQGYRCFGIIDGAFHQHLSVSIQEIDLALRHGAKIYGSSSMGALRAVETHPLGMIGIGKVFQWYLDEKIDADDEVAICFDETSGRALSEPLVNIRATLESFEEKGLISSDQRAIIFSQAEELHFSQRTYSNIVTTLKSVFPEQEIMRLKRIFIEAAVDQKGLDAEELLIRIKEVYEAYSNRISSDQTVFNSMATSS